jgi:hypothetical protein
MKTGIALLAVGLIHSFAGVCQFIQVTSSKFVVLGAIVIADKTYCRARIHRARFFAVIIAVVTVIKAGDGRLGFALIIVYAHTVAGFSVCVHQEIRRVISRHPAALMIDGCTAHHHQHQQHAENWPFFPLAQNGVMCWQGLLLHDIANR